VHLENHGDFHFAVVRVRTETCFPSLRTWWQLSGVEHVLKRFFAGPSKTLIPFRAPYPDAKTWQFSEGCQGPEMGAGLAAVGSQRGAPLERSLLRALRWPH
jgi:hypothetical protein